MNSKNFFFELIKKEKEARLGKIHTSRGSIKTPAFMPVGTQGTIKSIFVDDILKTGTEIILGNTYHLYLRPGIKIIKKFDGLHNFMNWKKPILTDSGGFQIMSLAKFTKIDKKINGEKELNKKIRSKWAADIKNHHVIPVKILKK